MKLADFAGLDPKLRRLTEAARSGQLVHALLFTGPRGTGKKSMAEILTRAVLCTGGGVEPCDVCPACKKCLAGQHPDVHVLEPDGRSIKIEQMRALLESMSLTSYEGGRKVALIRGADSMTEAAQNALLKTLEEPTGAALFILIAETPEALLPTIVSRCLRVRFHAVEIGDCASVLERRGIEAGRARELAAFARGSVGRALEIDADRDYTALRERVTGALEMLRAEGDVPAAAARLGDVKGREADVLEIMELWGRDLMCVQNGIAPLQTSETARLKASKLGGTRLLRCLLSARERLRANLSWTNVFEPMAYELVRRETRNDERKNTWLQS